MKMGRVADIEPTMNGSNGSTSHQSQAGNVVDLPFTELEFESPEQRADFERAASVMNMTPSEFTFHLFEWYRSQNP